MGSLGIDVVVFYPRYTPDFGEKLASNVGVGQSRFQAELFRGTRGQVKHHF